MNYEKKFKVLEKNNKYSYDEIKKNAISWAKSRKELQNSLDNNKLNKKLLVVFCRNCLDFNNVLMKNRQLMTELKIKFEPMLKQLNKDLNYCNIEKNANSKIIEIINKGDI